MKWEYSVQVISEFDADEVETMLDRRGKHGWELVAVSRLCMRYFFKRPLKDDNEQTGTETASSRSSID